MSGPGRAALYLRLSRDDEGCGESSSIGNQRALLTAYAREHGWTVAGEYVDDGWSGTSFQRPAFQRMLRDIEAGALDLVLTKDLSRLGRDYIRTGQYTEVYFPSKQVRYIAVNDGVDTGGPESDVAPFKNVVNEMYARDASRKIRSALEVKRRGGSYVGSFAPYGYRKDPADKNHLVPDAGAAPVVREIFARAARGAGPSEIARALNARGEPTPGRYRRGLDGGGCSGGRTWTAGTVSKLLRNVVYLGHTAQGKTTKVSFKSKLTVRNPPSRWVVVEHTHRPLVDPELFELVRRRMEGRACGARGRFSNLLSGLARCADCGHGMSTVGTRRRDSPASLACGGYKLRGAAACTNHFIDYNALYAAVLDALRAQVSLTGAERAELLRSLEAECAAPSGEEARQRPRLEAELARTEGLIERLYADRQSGALEEERFYRLLEKHQARCAELSGRLAALPADPPEDTRAIRARLEAELDRACALETLEADVLFAFLERVEVGQGAYASTPEGREKRQTLALHFRCPVREGEAQFLR